MWGSPRFPTFQLPVLVSAPVKVYHISYTPCGSDVSKSLWRRECRASIFGATGSTENVTYGAHVGHFGRISTMLIIWASTIARISSGPDIVLDVSIR